MTELSENKKFDMFLRNEYRTDGVKSQWRLDLERGRAEEEAAEQAWEKVYGDKR